MSLIQLLHEKRKLFSSIGASFVLETTIDPVCIQDLENRATQKDSTADYFVKELRKALNALKDPFDQDQEDRVLSIYGEVLVYVLLLRKGLLVERVSTRYGVKTPEFKVTCSSGIINIEVKTPSINAKDPSVPKSYTAYRYLITLAHEAYSKLRKRAVKPGIYFSELEINSYKPSAASHGPLPDQNSTLELTVAERIDLFLAKLKGMIKSGQLEHAPTILIIPLLRLPLLDPHPSSSLLPIYFDEREQCCVSGEYWHVACGQIGDQLFRYPSFPGATNLAGKQSQNGVMNEFEKLAAIGFLKNSWQGTYSLSAIFRDELTLDSGAVSGQLIQQCVEEIFDAYNDLNNELGWQYCVAK